VSEADRRREVRIPAKIAVQFHEPTAAAKALRAYSLNFSVGGLCLRTQKTYAIGQILELSVAIEKRALDLKGEVAWVRGGAIGVRFIELNPTQREALEELATALQK
jgi:uncharacterized protein (TIGR02266 family)